MAPSPRSLPVRCTSVAATVLRFGEDAARVLLLRRSRDPLADLWCQITGRIEAGETAAQAAAREIHEETGLVPEAFYSADFCDQFYNAEENCIDLVPIFVAIVGDAGTIRVNRENSDYRWVTVGEAIEIVPFVGHRSALRHVMTDFVERDPPPWRRISLG